MRLPDHEPIAPPALRGPSAAVGVPYDPSLQYLPDFVPPSRPAGPPPCGVPGVWWAQVEYLGWAVGGSALLPLLTSSPPGTPADRAGVLGNPGTVVLVGDDRLDNRLRSGSRLTSGFWLTPARTLGVEGSFFWLGDSTTGYHADVPGTGILARPLDGPPSAELVAFPGTRAGSVAVVSASGVIGAEANVRTALTCGPGWRVDGMGGYRFLNLHESLAISERRADLAGGNEPGLVADVFDRFQTSNYFHGGQLGLVGEGRFGRVSLDAFGKVAFGAVFKTAEVSGSTRYVSSGSLPDIRTGGLLTGPSNLGRQTSESFVVAPEVGVRLGYSLTERMRFYTAYNFLYWSNVSRPGDQIDLTPGRPLVWEEGNVWVQGISGGLEVRY
jgi:hypothetical protein